MKKQATAFDYARMCTKVGECSKCPIDRANDNGAHMWTGSCDNFIMTHRDEANEIILKWCEEHPVKTRQDKFLEIYPNAATQNGSIAICPKTIDETAKCGPGVGSGLCSDCKRDYWLAEVDE